MKIFSHSIRLIFYISCIFIVNGLITAALSMAKEFRLVRWIEDDTIGAMPLSAVAEDSRPYAGAVVDMRWRGKKTYEAEILKISRNKQELNKLCTSLIKFEITVEDILLESQNPQEIQESQITNSKPEKKTQVKKKTAKDYGKENKTPSAPTSSSAPTEKNKLKIAREKRKQQAKAKNATALEHAKTIFSFSRAFSLSSSDSDHSDIELEGEQELKSAERMALDVSVGKSKNKMLRTQLNEQQELIASLQEQLHESKYAAQFSADQSLNPTATAAGSLTTPTARPHAHAAEHAAVNHSNPGSGLSSDDNTQPDKPGPPAPVNRRLIRQYSLFGRGNSSPSTVLPQQSSQPLATPLTAPWTDQSMPPSSMMMPNKPSPPSPHPLSAAPWMGQQFTPPINQPSPPYPSMEDTMVTESTWSSSSMNTTTVIQKVQQSMVELVPGYGICCTQRQRDEVVSSSTTPGRLIRRLLPVFFSPETLATHSCSGRGKNPPLDEDVIAACIAFVQSVYKGTARSMLVDHINDKCSSYRRQKRTK